MDASKNNRTHTKNKRKEMTLAEKKLDSFGLKKRVMGKGLWNGNGGKIEPDANL